MPLKEVITPKELREYFRISASNLHNLCRRGELKFIRINKHGDRRFLRTDIEEYMKEKTDE